MAASPQARFGDAFRQVADLKTKDLLIVVMSVCKAMAASVTPRQTAAERLTVAASFAPCSTAAKAPEGLLFVRWLGFSRLRWFVLNGASAGQGMRRSGHDHLRGRRHGGVFAQATFGGGGLSGGADSTALLLAASRKYPGQVSAIHVNHGLQAAAVSFERHCVQLCNARCSLFVQRGRPPRQRPEPGRCCTPGALSGI